MEASTTLTRSAISESEFRALELLIAAGGSRLTTTVPERNEKDIVFGTIDPGHPVYRKLERKGFVYYTVEDPVDLPGDPLHGFTFTNEICITDEGRAAILLATSK